ncbi:MAG: hypothetical protein ACI9YL_001440 [Luteibaculaceae bacterium]|jgi:hypothetical protein
MEYIQIMDTSRFIFLTLFALPILLVSWIAILKTIGTPKRLAGQITVFILVLSVFSLCWLRFYDLKSKQYPIAQKRIIHFLKDHQWDQVGFLRIQQNVDEKYNAVFLRKLIDRFPADFSLVTLEGNVDAVGLMYFRDEPSVKSPIPEPLKVEKVEEIIDTASTPVVLDTLEQPITGKEWLK